MFTTNPYIIAEIGVNHDGDLDKALELIERCANAGANAVKFQFFDPHLFVADNLELAGYQKANTEVFVDQKKLLSSLAMGDDWLPHLIKAAKRNRVDLLGSAFDLPSLEVLESTNPKFHKIASGELTNSLLLFEVFKKGRPIILSTGMASAYEVERTLKFLTFCVEYNRFPCTDVEWESRIQAHDVKNSLQDKVILMQCTSNYPTLPGDVNLAVINAWTRLYGLQTGFSDHTIGSLAAIIAVGLGAMVIEKHVTLDVNGKGPDHCASLHIDDLSEFTRMLRSVPQMLGVSNKRASATELETREVVRQRLVYSRSIKKGEIISLEDLSTRRGLVGECPMNLAVVLGKSIARNVGVGDPLLITDFPKAYEN